MLTKEMKELFLNEVFEYKKGRLLFKNPIYLTLLNVPSPHNYTSDERVEIAYLTLLQNLDKYEPKASWFAISSNRNHPEWTHIKKKTYTRSKFKIMEKENGLEEDFLDDIALENLTIDDKFHSMPDNIIWAKANKGEILTPIQLNLYNELVKANYPEKNWTVRYRNNNPHKKSKPIKQAQSLSETILMAWQSVKDSKNVRKDYLAFLDHFLDLDPQEMKETIHYHVEEDTPFASLILYKLPIEEVIEINLYCQGKGDIEKDTLYQIGNIVMDYIESEEDSTYADN